MVFLRIFLFAGFSLLWWHYMFPSANENEFRTACENELAKIPELVEFWKQQDKKNSDANERLENEYQDRVSAFYRGELSSYPGRVGSVGKNLGFHIGRAIVHHETKYYDSNLKKEVEFNVFPDGMCKRK